MRLGTKFVLLIAGTFIVPLITVLLMALVALTVLPNQNRLNTLRTIFRADAIRKERIDPAEVLERVREISPTLEVLVYSAEGTLVSSSLPTDSIRQLLSPTGYQVHTFSRFPMLSRDGTPYSLVLGIPLKSTDNPSWQRFIPMIALLSVLAFMILMSVFIIRSINTSIARLEEGTRRISEGDMDFQLEARGNDRIASLTRSFDNMRRRVQEETATRSRFIMAVSHDLKTPLSSITGYLDAIGDGIASDPAQLDKYLAIIRDKAGLLESRIGQLIDYVKLDTADWRRSRDSIALGGFLNEAVTVFRTEAEARGFGFDAAVRVPPAVSLMMDGDLVYRALENLVQNAFRYGEPESTIRFRAETADGATTLRISNRGPGIPAEDLPFIFEPFFRGTRARREGGFGLGLSVVKFVVTSHGWDIAAESGNGETSFTLTIPT